MFFAAMFTPENMAFAARSNEAWSKARDECIDAGIPVPLPNCGCSTCQGYYINIALRVPREFGGYFGEPLPDPQLEDIRENGT